MMTLPVNPYTPPGRYEAELLAGHEEHIEAERRRRAVIIVSERLATVLSPARLLLSTIHRKSEHRVVVRNDGNVPLRIDDIGALTLEDRDLQCRVIRETVHRSPPHPNWDELVGTAVDVLKKNFGDIDPLKVRTKNKPVHIAPGETALLILEVEVPKVLPLRNFSAGTTIGDAALVFDLNVSLRH